MEMWQIEYRLLHSAPEFVYEWLESNLRENFVPIEDKRDRLEKRLLKRDDPLINLGLAMYGECPDIGYKLYKRGNRVMKRASLSGRSVKPYLFDDSWILGEDVLPRLLECQPSKKSSELLAAALGNKYLPDKILESLFNKTDLFHGITDDNWLKLIHFVSKNSRLSTPYFNVWMDGYAEYNYNAVFCAAWRLFTTVPMTENWAIALLHLSENLVAEPPSDMDILETIERWRPDIHGNDELFSEVRTTLVRLLRNYGDEFKGLKEHHDLALRKGYYSFINDVEPDDVRDWFARDGKDFLDAALYNNAFFKNDETRLALDQSCWDVPDDGCRMDYPNYFRARESELLSSHPEWFEDQ